MPPVIRVFPAPIPTISGRPEYIHMSLIFDTLIWKDKNGFTGSAVHRLAVSGGLNAYQLSLLRQDVHFWHDDTRLRLKRYCLPFSIGWSRPILERYQHSKKCNGAG